MKTIIKTNTYSPFLSKILNTFSGKEFDSPVQKKACKKLN